MKADESKDPKGTQSPAPRGAGLFTAARPRRTFEEIITQIQARIQDGTFRQGDRLPAERELAQQFQVSRNTVREALRSLEISGYLTLKRGAGGGAFLTDPNPQMLNQYLTRTLKVTDFSAYDLTQAMRGITMLLLTTAAPVMGDSDFEALENNLEEGRRMPQSPERTAKVLSFYKLLAEATGNKILVAIAEVLIELLQGWVERLGSLSGDKIFESRARLLNHLRAKDHAAAQAELDAYLKELHALWLKGKPK